MKKRFLLKTMLLLCALIAGSSSMWAASYVKVTSASDLVAGETYILAEISQPTKYLVTGYGIELGNTTSGFSVSSNTLTTSTATPLEFTLGIVKDGDNTYYTLKYSENDYLGWNGFNNCFETATSTTDSKEQWKISPSGDGYQIKNVLNDTRFIGQYNSHIYVYQTSTYYPECYLFKKQHQHTGTINFGSDKGSTKIQGSSSSGTGTVTYTDTGDDSQGNTWTITTVTSKSKSFTQNASYSQVGSSSNPVTSITFTTTLPSSQTIKAFSAKLGGFSSTAGDVTLKVGSTTVGSGELDATNDVTVEATNTTTSGTELTVTVTNIAKGVKCYYISYMYETSTLPSNANFTNKTPSIDWPTNTTYTQAATTAAGYTGTVTYSIGGTNSCGATINASTGEVSFTKGGTVVVNATAAEVAGQFTQSSDSYTLTVNDVRPAATLSWSENSVEIFKDAVSYTLPTLNNPNSLEVTYTVEGTDGLASVTSAGIVTVNTGTVGSATVKASFAGNNSYKPKNATYTINVVDPTVKGSKYNPYTVAEVIDGTATGSNVYVKGFIVGEYPSSGTSITTSSFTTDANVALADSYSPSTAKSSAIPIQLNTNALKNAWGNKTNGGATMGYQVLIKGTVDTYFTVNGIKPATEVTAIAVASIIASSGYSTLARGFGLDFANADPAGLEAYVVPSITKDAVSLTAVNEAPASTGVILKGTAGTTYTIPVKAAAIAVGTNKLQAAVKATPLDDGSFYIMKGGKFCLVTGAANEAARTVPAGKAYLLKSDVPAAASELVFDFDGEATGINAVYGSELKVNGEFYNLAGQRVVKPTKGLYIMNGKKVVIK